MRVPTVEWQVAGGCNYDCSYCIQSRRYRRGGIDGARLHRAIEFLRDLPGTWEVKLSGGEAFAHRAFLDALVPSLIEQTPHRVSTLTNFSAGPRDLMRFVQMTRGRLAVFSASYHPEFATLDAFVAKAAWLVAQLDDGVDFVVNQVVVPGREADAERCRDALAERGIRWYPQLLKQSGGVAGYPDEARLAELLDGRSVREVNRAPSYRGRLCWSGVEYLTIDKDGRAWSCRTAKRNDEGLLGNVLDGTVVLRPIPVPCPYDICPCSVPANRGMIEGVPATVRAAHAGAAAS